MKGYVGYLIAIALCFVFSAAQGQEQTLPVGLKSKVFISEDFVTFGGETIPEVRVGWEAYGELNEEKDNVILINSFLFRHESCCRSISGK